MGYIPTMFDRFKLLMVELAVKKIKDSGVAGTRAFLEAQGYCSDDNAMASTIAVDVIVDTNPAGALPVKGTDFNNIGTLFIRNNGAGDYNVTQYTETNAGVGSWIRRYECTSIFNASSSNVVG